MRGRTVVYHGDQFTRPMKDKVRESLFNIIGPRIKGSRSIDFFAGTGAVAFEALSRGAAEVTAIEKNRKAYSFLESTAKQLGANDRMTILLGDAFRLGSGILGPVAIDEPCIDTPQIVFLCPPYAMWESESESLANLVRLAVENGAPGSLIVAETDKHFDPDRLPAGQWEHRLYGNSRLSFLEPPLVCGLRM